MLDKYKIEIRVTDMETERTHTARYAFRSEVPLDMAIDWVADEMKYYLKEDDAVPA